MSLCIEFAKNSPSHNVQSLAMPMTGLCGQSIYFLGEQVLHLPMAADEYLRSWNLQRECLPSVSIVTGQVGIGAWIDRSSVQSIELAYRSTGLSLASSV